MSTNKMKYFLKKNIALLVPRRFASFSISNFVLKNLFSLNIFSFISKTFGTYLVTVIDFSYDEKLIEYIRLR